MRGRASIMHLDLDAFFAAVEQRDKPSLRGRPVVVGGTGPRGVVSTASYEARVYGVRSAMRTIEARARCPHAAYLAGRFGAYRESSRIVMDRLREVSPLVEPLSLDEAFVDLAAAPGSPDLDVEAVTEVARAVRRDVERLTGGLTASVGLASSKLMAKIASELDKPDGLHVVVPGTEAEVLAPMPVRVVPGVGPATAERLRRMGLHTVGDVQRSEVGDLVSLLGSAHGTSLHALARAEDDRPVVAEREAKSVSVEDTFETDLTDPALLAGIAERMAARVAERLATARLSGRTVTLKVRHHDFETHTRSSTLAGPTDDRRVVARTALRLLAGIDVSSGVRLLGVGVSGLADWVQDDLFADLDDPVQSVPEATSPEPLDTAPPTAGARSAEDGARRFPPGADVVHAEHGRGWVWGGGLGRVTVRFETRETGPGPVRTFAADDPALAPVPAADGAPGTPTTARDDPSAAPASVSGMSETVPPVAPERPSERTHHGRTVQDPYEWLRAKDDPATISHLEAENAYAQARTAHLDGLRERLFTEVKERTQETDMSVPARRGGWWYYARTVEGQQYALRCRCPVADADDWTPPEVAEGREVPGEQVLLDGNAEAEGHDFYSVGAFSVSEDGHLLAWSVDTTGDERFTLRVRDLRTGETLPDVVEGVHYGATWSRSGSHLFYTTVDDAWRPHRVWRHRLGQDGDDALVHHEDDDRFFTGIGASRSGRYLMIASGSKITSEYRVLDADDPEGEFAVVEPRRDGVEYAVEHAVIAGEDVFLLLHNDGAENFELVQAPAATPGREHWRTLVPHRPDVRLDDVDAFAGHLVLSLRRDALTRLQVLPLGPDGPGEPHEIDTGEELFSIGLGGNPEWDPPTLRVGATSFVTPSTVYDLVLATGELVVRKQQQVLGGFDPTAYEQHRTWAVADDGTRVPVSVVCRRGTPRDGSAPAVLYGYGAYETSIDPGFSISRLSMLDRGVVYAVAHVRGGGELGRHWYDDGKTLRKRHTFTDFVACARHLVAEGWTSHERLVAEGGSAGGLLVGAVANLAPEAFAGVLAVVPFVDALTSILDPSLPLTVIEWDEWGDPLHDPEVYDYMASYSPYDNVRTADYPAILAVSSLHDTRVLYVEPTKWVARLRALNEGAGQVLLKTEMSAGHGGVSGRYEAWRERAFELAWVLDVLGVADRDTGPAAGPAPDPAAGLAAPVPGGG